MYNLPTKLGFWSSLAGVFLALLYLLALLGNWMAVGSLYLTEPYQSVISMVLFLACPLLVFETVALHGSVQGSRQTLSLLALCLVVIFAALGGVNRYISLTVVPQSVAAGKTAGLEWFMPFGWPSVTSALEVLAWGLFLGLAFLVIAPIFRSDKLDSAIFWTCIVTGLLCLLALIGQVFNAPFLLSMGLLAWGPGLFLFLILMAVWFRKRAY
jgi:hypothetical protein